MAYSWTHRPVAGDFIRDVHFDEVKTVADYVKNNHCPSNCSNNSDDGGYDSNWSYDTGDYGDRSYCSVDSYNAVDSDKSIDSSENSVCDFWGYYAGHRMAN
jgi:hypothetical protein